MATSMQEILEVTRQTTEGTEQTAMSVGALAAMGKELKGSVARFKVDREYEQTRRFESPPSA